MNLGFNLWHKNINNTRIYIHLADALFREEQEYVSRAVKTVPAAQVLVEAGFDYIAGAFNNGDRILEDRSGRHGKTEKTTTRVTDLGIGKES